VSEDSPLTWYWVGPSCVIVTPEPAVMRFGPPSSVRESADRPKLDGSIGSVKVTETELTGVLRGPGVIPVIVETAGAAEAITQLVNPLPEPVLPEASWMPAAFTVKM